MSFLPKEYRLDVTNPYKGLWGADDMELVTDDYDYEFLYGAIQEGNIWEKPTFHGNAYRFYCLA